jgi:hypothetical protein
MGMVKRSVLLIVATAVFFGFGGLTAHKLPQLKRTLSPLWKESASDEWDN